MTKTQKNTFLADVKIATKSLRDIFDATPLQRNAHLSNLYDSHIYLKREDLTPVRSYKIRGAFNFFRKAIATQKKSRQVGESLFVCASAGNHAQGFAYACQHFGVNGVVFMPVTTPQQKIDKTRVFGKQRIEIKLVGDIFDDCNKAAIAYAEKHKAKMVPPFDHDDIIEGQASVGQEILDQINTDIDILIVPVGGGGLSAGLCEMMEQCSPHTQIIFVEPEGAPSFKRSLESGKRVILNHVNTFVDGAAVAMIGENNFQRLKERDPKSVMLVNENALCQTIIEMLNVEGIVLEPAGALAVHALRLLPADQLADRTIVCVTSGGNFDFERLPDVKERALKSAGLKKFIILAMPQRPGALKDFLNLLGPEDDIARFEYMKKSARNFGSVLIGVETKDPANFDVLFAKMHENNFRFEDITDNDTFADFIL